MELLIINFPSTLQKHHSALQDKILRLLTFLHHSQVCIELAAMHRGDKFRWQIVALVEIVKFDWPIIINH